MPNVVQITSGSSTGYASDSSPGKKRKIRKGTTSCWECKRRKIKCSSVDPNESACDGCRSRGLKCMGQESPNETLISKIPVESELCSGILSPQMPNRRKDVGSREALANHQEHRETQKNASLKTPIIPTSSRPTNLQLKYHAIDTQNLSESLRSAWPSQRTLKWITHVVTRTLVLFHGTVCTPYSTVSEQGIPSPSEEILSSFPESHPVLMARKLLMLGSLLQSVSRKGSIQLKQEGVKCHEIMTNAVATASRLVVSNDDLIDSLEGLECIMLESMYQNNAGQLRKAWIKNRRAITIAQTLGLHTDNSPSPKALESTTRKRVNPANMWIRLVSTDRYLSLILGLPQSCPESPFATLEALMDCAPLDCIERREANIGGLIIQRNMNDLRDIEATQHIDKLLQEAASSMPSQWWLPPDIRSSTGSNEHVFNETIRLMIQFTHYHLLAQLHLPCVLHNSTDRQCQYSKITAVNASLEVLSRFVSFRDTSATAVYCRGIDFLAFIASTTLCLGHMESQRHPGTGNSSTYANTFRFLTHQRPADRGLSERVLEILESMAKEQNGLALRISRMLRRLLAIEEAVFQGSSWTHVSLVAGGQGFLLNEDVVNDNHDGTLSIDVPYIGLIKIQYGGQEISQEVALSFLHENEIQSSNLGFNIESQELGSDGRNFELSSDAEEGHNGDEPNHSVHTEEWGLESVDMALFDSFTRGLV